VLELGGSLVGSGEVRLVLAASRVGERSTGEGPWAGGLAGWGEHWSTAGAVACCEGAWVWMWIGCVADLA
jgi:hypothetical protein